MESPTEKVVLEDLEDLEDLAALAVLVVLVAWGKGLPLSPRLAIIS